MKFSAIICTYNPKREWLERAINSCTGLFDEVIIVDDGSDEQVGAYDGCLTVRVSHAGLHNAKNTGVQNATGDIICFLDDDDFFDHDGVISLQNYIEDDTEANDIWHFHLQEFNQAEGLYGVNASPSELANRNSISGVSWFRKGMWSTLVGFQYPLAEDWDFWYRAWKLGFKFHYFPHTVYHYNTRHDSRSHKWGMDMHEKMRKEITSRTRI